MTERIQPPVRGCGLKPVNIECTTKVRPDHDDYVTTRVPLFECERAGCFFSRQATSFTYSAVGSGERAVQDTLELLVDDLGVDCPLGSRVNVRPGEVIFKRVNE